MQPVFSIFLILLLLLGGNHGHTDLLDAISTQVYWQLKNVAPDLAQLQKDAGNDAAPASIDAQVKDLGASDFATRDKARQELERMGPAILPMVQPLTHSQDAEVAAVADNLVTQFTQSAQQRAIRRLMAIRTLGERREKEALPLLRSLQASPEMFVPEYAARAIAQINGENYRPADISAAMAADLRLLPAETALAGQSTGLASRPLTIASIVEAISAGDSPDNLPPGAVARAKPNPDQLIQQASTQLLSLLERVGNIRIDGITVGLTYTRDQAPPQPNVGNGPPAAAASEHGWAVLIIRGQFNAAAAQTAFKELVGNDADITPARNPGDVTIIADKEAQMTVLIPGDHQVIFLTAPNPKDAQAAREKFLTALKAGKGTFDDNKDLAQLMKDVDIKAPVWAVAKFTDAMSAQVLDGTFKTIALSTKPLPDGSTDFTVRAQTVDADKAKAAMDSIGADLKSALDDIRQEVKAMPRLAPAADFLASMKLSVDGASGTLTGSLPATLFNAVISEMPVMEMLTPRPAPVMNVPPPPLPVPAQPAPPQ